VLLRRAQQLDQLVRAADESIDVAYDHPAHARPSPLWASSSWAWRTLVPIDGPEPSPLDEAVDHVRGPAGGHLIVEYGDYECPYSRAAYRAIQRLERPLGGSVRFALRHFGLDLARFGGPDGRRGARARGS